MIIIRNSAFRSISTSIRPMTLVFVASVTAAMFAAVFPVFAQSPTVDSPVKPEGLAGHADDGSVSLSWEDPADASITGYGILRRDPETQDAGVFDVLVDDTGSSDTSYVDTDVVADKHYVYRVVAINAAGSSPRSDFYAVFTEATVDLGDVTSQESVTFLRQSIGGGPDREDLFSFTLTAAKVVGIGLRRLEADADLYLEDADGGVLARSENRGTADEWISSELPSGTYQARVTAIDPGANEYRFRYGVGEAETVDLEEPDTTSTRSTEVLDPTDTAEPEEPDVEPIEWSATMTVGLSDAYVPPFHGFSLWGDDLGSLSSNTFGPDFGKYRVVGILLHADGLYFHLSRAFPNEFTLTIDGHEFLGSDSLKPPTGGGGRYWWGSPGLSWADGDSFEVGVSVDAAAEPLAEPAASTPTAHFYNFPESHDGAGAVTFQIVFSEDLLVTSEAQFDDALVVGNGTRTSATRNGARWTITVQPDSDADVSVALLAGLACDAAGAICASDGRKLHNQVEMIVPGPEPPSSDAELSALRVSDVDPAPAFSASQTLYTATAAEDVDSITVETETSDADAYAEISPEDSDASTEGHQVSLAPGGETAVTVTVTAADGSTTMRYWLVVTRAPSSSGETEQEEPARLSDLDLGGLAPIDFEEDDTRYEVEADPQVTETTVVVSKEESDSTVEVLTVRSDDAALQFDDADADAGASGHQSELSSSGDTLILVRVTSADGKRQRIYVILVKGTGGAQSNGGTSKFLHAAAKAFDSKPGAKIARAAAVTPTLSALSLTGGTISPAFAAGTVAYTASVAATVSSVTVSATAADANAHVLIVPVDADADTAGRQVALPEGEAGGEDTVTTIAVIVRSSDGSKLNAYLIDVTRAAPAGEDATLSSLTIGDAALTPAFDAEIHSYTASVANTVSTVTVGPALSDDDAEFDIDPADDDDTTDGHQVDLALGVTEIVVTVTADDDTTTRTYSVNVSRGASADASLSALSIDGVTISPTFHTDVLSYVATVADTVSRVTVSATPRDDGATIGVDPEEGAADLASTGYQIELAPGATRILVTAAAENGAHSRTYALIVGRTATEQDATLSRLEVTDSALPQEAADVKLKPAFTDGVFTYEAKAEPEVSQVTVWPFASNVLASVEVIPPDVDLEAPGHQIRLAPVVDGGQPSETVIGIVVTSVDASAVETYAVSVTLPAPLLDADQYLNFDLPDGCRIKPLLKTIDGNRQAYHWLPKCRSILEYIEFGGSGVFATGYAHFYYLKVNSDGPVKIEMQEWDTSHHIVLRSNDGTELEHIFYQIDHIWDGCNGYGVPCASSPLLETTLDAGDYVIEIVQHYSTTGRRRLFEFDVTGDVALVGKPELTDIAIDGTTISGFDAKQTYYGVDRTAAEITISATAASEVPAHEVIVYPEDADPDTAGHQVAVAAVGLTDVWFNVVDHLQLSSKTYRVRVFGDPPPGTALTAEFLEVPATYRRSANFSFLISFSEPIRTSFRYLRNQTLAVDGGKAVKAVRVDGDSGLWRITVRPDLGNRQPITITLPATTSTCAPLEATCSFFGKRLSNSVAATLTWAPRTYKAAP